MAIYGRYVTESCYTYLCCFVDVVQRMLCFGVIRDGQGMETPVILNIQFAYHN